MKESCAAPIAEFHPARAEPSELKPIAANPKRSRPVGGVRLLLIVHRRLRLLTFPPRTIWPRGPMADQEISRFPYKELADMPEVFDHAGPSRRSRWRV